jgi:hypothetical protein
MQGVALGELFATATPQRRLLALQIAPNVEDKAAAISLSCGGLKPLTGRVPEALSALTN